MRMPRNVGARARAVAIGVVLVLMLAAGAWWALTPRGGPRFTAYFTAAVGLFPGSDVRVLGMRIGSVTSVVPEGNQVRVEMALENDDTPVPADARAMAVAPSLVSDRYVQLAPTYHGGARLADGAVIPRERTDTPMELDEINRNTDRAIRALGPDGANKQGALSDYLDVTADNLRGNGAAINDMIRQFAQASSTLSGSKEDLYATVDNLQRFTKTLADSDQQVRQFDNQLADAAGFLANERGDLGRALDDLGPALEDTTRFIQQNQSLIKSNVDHLSGVTQVLVDQRKALAEVLDVAPLGLSNLAETYDATTGTSRSRGNMNELTNPPIVLVCKLLRQAPPAKPVPPVLADMCDKIRPIVDGVVPLPSPAQAITSLQQGKPPDLPLPLVRVMREAGAGGR